MEIQYVLLDVPPWVLGPLWYIVVILIGVEILIPRLWVLIEQVWWRLWLGSSPTSELLRRHAMDNFQKSIDQNVFDGAIPRPLAVIMAVTARPFELRNLTVDLKSLKNEMIVETFESAIEQLNKLWREGTPPQILQSYIKVIEDSAKDAVIERKMRLHGMSAIAIVKYALGDIKGGNDLGKKNWKEAKLLEPDDESELKWLASYGYFYSTLFLGKAIEAMILMADQWSKYYAPLTADQKKSLRQQLSDKLILNPILAIPRHIILAAAFNETPIFEKNHWPSEDVYNNLDVCERECKIRWVEAWYEEARRICEAEPTSLNFSRAYTGFYLTLLLLEPGMPAAYLHNRINEAFNAIDGSAAIVAQYVKFGFSGVYHLVIGDNEKALDHLSRAASFSAISGNRFADCIFMCSHAVAAARLTRPRRYMEPDIKYYLSEAEKLARSINRNFYKKLYYAAKAAVCLQRGDKAEAEKYAQRSRQGQGGNRILGIFQSGELELRKSEARRNTFNLIR